MRMLKRPASSSSMYLQSEDGPEMLFGDVARPDAPRAIEDSPRSDNRRKVQRDLAHVAKQTPEDNKLHEASGAMTAVMQKIEVLKGKVPKNKKTTSLHKNLDGLKSSFAKFLKDLKGVFTMDTSPARTEAAKALMKEFNKKGDEFKKVSVRAKELLKK